MCVGIISGIIAGFLCAIGTWAFQCLWNISAKETVLTCMSRLKIYCEAINNDINCGQEFPSVDLYHLMTEKASFALAYLDEAQDSIKFLNFRWRGRKHILAQMKEIENDLKEILTLWQLANNDADEWKSRFNKLASEQQTLYFNMTCYRIEVITALAKTRFPFLEKGASKIIDSTPVFEDPDGEEGYTEIIRKLKMT